MAILPWRFQCDLTIDDQGAEPFISTYDPEVTVFVAETYTSDSTGKKMVNRDTSYPVRVKASQLPTFLEVSVKGIDLEQYPRDKPAVFGQPPAPKEEEEDEPVHTPMPKRGKR